MNLNDIFSSRSAQKIGGRLKSKLTDYNLSWPTIINRGRVFYRQF